MLRTHTDMGVHRIKKDENYVQTLTDFLESKWVDPFTTYSQLVSLSIATSAT